MWGRTRALRERYEMLRGYVDGVRPDLDLVNEVRSGLPKGPTEVDRAALVEGVRAAVREQRLLTALDGLPPLERFALLCTTFPDDEALKVAEEELRKSALARAGCQDRLAELQEDARIFRGVDLGRVPLHALVSFDLHLMSELEEKGGNVKSAARNSTPRRVLTAAVIDGGFSVVNDLLPSDYDDRALPYLPAQQRIGLGSFDPGVSGTQLTSRVYLGGTLGCTIDHGGDPERHLLQVRDYYTTEQDLFIGRVTVGDVPVLCP